MKEPGKKPLTKKGEPLTIHYASGPKAKEEDDGIRYVTVVEFGLDKKLREAGANLELSFSYVVLEDEDRSGDVVGHSAVIEGDESGTFDDGLTGRLIGEQVVRVRFTSAVIPDGQSLQAKAASSIIKKGVVG